MGARVSEGTLVQFRIGDFCHVLPYGLYPAIGFIIGLFSPSVVCLFVLYPDCWFARRALSWSNRL